MIARICTPPLALAAVIASAAAGFLAMPAYARAQAAAPDSVESIRRLLRTSPVEGDRDRRLCDSITSLNRLDDLARVLSLAEWNVEPGEFPGAGGRDSPRVLASRRFEEQIRAELESSSTARRAFALEVLIETGKRGRLGIAFSASPQLTEAIVLLLRDENVTLSGTAAIALARVRPDPEVAVRALDRLLDSREPERGRAALRALAELLESARQGVSEENEHLRLGPARDRLLRTATLTVPAAGLGIWSPDVEMRRLSATLIGQGASALIELTHDPRWRYMTPEGEKLLGDCDTLALALKHQVGTVRAALRDPDSRVRLLSGQALEQMAAAIPALCPPPVLPPPPGKDLIRTSYREPALARGDAPPTEAQKTFAAVVARLRDSDVRARLNAIDVLESLGPGSAAAVPDLIQTLTDRNSFVRWAAARTLGKIGPTDSGRTAAALGRLLNDPDPDVRLAAAESLDRFGPEARSALPELVRALGCSDPALGLAVARVLFNIGAEARSALPDLQAAARDSDPRVRRLLAELLTKLESDHKRDP